VSQTGIVAKLAQPMSHAWIAGQIGDRYRTAFLQRQRVFREADTDQRGFASDRSRKI
jgi:hypothetical protein